MKKLSALLTVLIGLNIQAQQQTLTVPPSAPEFKACLFALPDGTSQLLGGIRSNRRITETSVIGKGKTENLPLLFEPDDLEMVDIKYITPQYQKDLQEDLVKGGQEQMFLRRSTHTAVLKMLDAAWKDGIDLYIHSGYRSYQVQCGVFCKKLKKEMISTQADFQTSFLNLNSRSAQPGQSEHQLGSTIDFVTYLEKYEKPEKKYSGYAVEYEMEQTPAYEWLTKNASKYGFAMSYPYLDRRSFQMPHPETGYIFEPWHWRYISVKHAQNFTKCPGLTLKNYLIKIQNNPAFTCNKSTQPQKPFKLP